MSEFKVQINKNNLPEENEQFPSDYQYYAEACAKAEAAYNTARNKRKLLEAELLVSYKTDGVKRTVDELNSLVTIAPTVKEAKTDELVKQEAYLVLNSTVEALNQKSYALKNLTVLQIGGFYAGAVDRAMSETVSDSIRKNLNNKE